MSDEKIEEGKHVVPGQGWLQHYLWDNEVMTLPVVAWLIDQDGLGQPLTPGGDGSLAPESGDPPTWYSHPDRPDWKDDPDAIARAREWHERHRDIDPWPSDPTDGPAGGEPDGNAS